MKDYKKILEGVVNIVNTSENSDAVANICAYIDENCPELKESEDERIRKGIIDFLWKEKIFLQEAHSSVENNPKYRFVMDAIAWLERRYEEKPVISGDALREGIAHFGITQYQIDNWLKKYVGVEKQGEQKPTMIQWKGDNLKEVIDFTGKDKNFEKWFKSFEEYEKYVQEHDGIFKLFNADGSHYEVRVGAWLIKTPDNRIVASQSTFVPKSPEKSESSYITPHKKFFEFIYGRLVNKYGENPTVDYMLSFKERIDDLFE